MNRRDTGLTRGQERGGPSPCVCNTLRMVTRAVTQLYDDLLRPSGLRVTQFSILAAIARMGETNLRQLADTLAIDQTTLTRSLNLLERDGVIERVPHPDGRIKTMALTSRGEGSSTSRGRCGPRRKTRSSATWGRGRGPTRDGGWPTCFRSPSGGEGRVEAGGGCGRGAHREDGARSQGETVGNLCALLSFQHLTGTGDLTTTSYGRMIVAKLATLIVVLALAMAARRGRGGGPERWWRGELAALVVLLLLAAALVSLPPPA